MISIFVGFRWRNGDAIRSFSTCKSLILGLTCGHFSSRQFVRGNECRCVSRSWCQSGNRLDGCKNGTSVSHRNITQSHIAGVRHGELIGHDIIDRGLIVGTQIYGSSLDCCNAGGWNDWLAKLINLGEDEFRRILCGGGGGVVDHASVNVWLGYWVSGSECNRLASRHSLRQGWSY